MTAKRPTKEQRYESEKCFWLMRHPYATPNQYEEFIKALIKRLGL